MIDVKDPALDLNYRDETTNSNTALHMASANGHLHIVKLLLEQADMNVNIINDSGNTPLHYASFNGHLEVVRVLIENKADANIKNENGNIAIEEALSQSKRDIAEMLAPVSKLEEDKFYASYDQPI